MLYYGKDIFGISIILSGKVACKEFLGLSTEHHKKIFDALKNLPAGLYIRDGYLDSNSRASPPYDKVWNNPIPCNELTDEDYADILTDLEILTFDNLPDIGPALDLAKIFVPQREVPDAIRSMKILYNLLIKPETKVDSLVILIKRIKDWNHYIDEKEDWGILLEKLRKANEKVEEPDFMRAIKILRRDPEHITWRRENFCA